MESSASSSSASSLTPEEKGEDITEEEMQENPVWRCGNFVTLTRDFSTLLKFTVEEFRQYLVDTKFYQYSRQMEHLQEYPSSTLFSCLVQPASLPARYFCNYARTLINSLVDGKRIDLLRILMEQRIFCGAYYETRYTVLKDWVKESRLDFFQLYLAQGHSLFQLGRGAGEYIAKYGSIDILDFFLATEDEGDGKRIFGPDVVYHAVWEKNVDMLDRLLVRGYPVNEEIIVEDNFFRHTRTLPIYAAVKNPINRTDVLDRLIMAGADVNLTADNETSVLVTALSRRSTECVNRLLDVGAKFNNALDTITFYRDCEITAEILDKLVAAGMDVNYPSDMGTPLAILKALDRVSFTRVYLEDAKLLQEKYPDAREELPLPLFSAEDWDLRQ